MFGLKSSDMDTQNPEFDMVPIYPQRVAEIDADFICYQLACTRKADQEKIDAGLMKPRTLDELFAGAQEVMARLARMAGAESYKAHITPGGTTKGNRAVTALTKPYQGNRADTEKPEHLDALRGMIGEAPFGVVHIDQEADDGMTQANYAACLLGDPKISVIISRDKDLRMAPGLHWDFNDEKIVEVPLDSFGWLYQEQHELPSGKMSPKKTLGYGPAFFWAQCLMGDTADNIAGLPKIDGEFLFNQGVGKAGQKDRLCGAALAFALIESAASNYEAFLVVQGAFATSPHEWINHHTQEPCTAMQALGGDMRSLWMRRSVGDEDFAKFFNEEINPHLKVGDLT